MSEKHQNDGPGRKKEVLRMKRSGHLKVRTAPAPKPCFKYFDRFEGSPLWPRYNARALESYFLKCAFAPVCFRLRFALCFVGLNSLVWGAYTKAIGTVDSNAFLFGGIAVLILCFATFGVTFNQRFQSNYRIIGGIWAIFLSAMMLGLYAISPAVVSFVVMACGCLQVLLINYTLVPVPLLFSLILNTVLSIVFELLMFFIYDFKMLLAIRVITQLVIHLIGIHLHISYQARQRSTFTQLCQSVHTKRLIRIERVAKLGIIRCLMPDKMAQELMEKADTEHMKELRARSTSSGLSSESENEVDESKCQLARGVSVFHEFHGNHMDNVSILYADIIGIWNTSKSSQEAVMILNDIYSCLDQLCEAAGCEKITTLGDCYHCVAGCPDPAADHAERCVEFGRSMCVAIQRFNRDVSGQTLDMRVGVHSGTVVYGIMGVHRFKFDVWSNDVNLAREMKTNGENGRVHVSADTLEFVRGLYDVEEARSVPDLRKIKVLVEYFDVKKRRYSVKECQEHAEIQTYFITGRKDGQAPKALSDVKSVDEEDADAADEFTRFDISSDNPRHSNVDRLVEDLRCEVQTKVFSFPPISPLTLHFRDARTERRFRCEEQAMSTKKSMVLTPASWLVSPVLDVGAFLVLLLLVGGACFALPAVRPPIVLGAVLVVALTFSTVAVLLPAVHRLVSDVRAHNASNYTNYKFLARWCPRNIVGAFLLALPVTVVLSTFEKCSLLRHVEFTFGFSLLLFVSFTSFALFSMYSFWTKFASAFVTAVALSALYVASHVMACDGSGLCSPLSNSTVDGSSELPLPCNITSVSSVFQDSWPSTCVQFIVSLIFIFLLISFLARDSEIYHRLDFKCGLAAREETHVVRRTKKQADWLLKNIIPSRIIGQLQVNRRYCEEIDRCGVIFANISNFSHFYDEQYNGGQAMLTILNEIFSDIETILSLQKYEDVEKIKTVGSCFMAASGLHLREGGRTVDDLAHVRALMDFCIDIGHAVREFNKNMFSFDFELKIGFAVGPLTAGVFGKKRLLYDVLGDAVNQAFLLCSRGSALGIRVNSAVVAALRDAFEFEPSDDVVTRGGETVSSFLLLRRK